jgi:hypothetical protein
MLCHAVEDTVVVGPSSPKASPYQETKKETELLSACVGSGGRKTHHAFGTTTGMALELWGSTGCCLLTLGKMGKMGIREYNGILMGF